MTKAGTWPSETPIPFAGAARRFWLVLTAGPTGLAVVSCASFRAGLLVAGVSQALIAAALAGLLAVGLCTEFSRWVVRSFDRRRGTRKRHERRSAATRPLLSWV